MKNNSSKKVIFIMAFVLLMIGIIILFIMNGINEKNIDLYDVDFKSF